MTHVLISLLALMFYTYFGYLMLILIMGRLLKKTVHKADIEPTVAIMIAAYNEEKSITEKIQNSLKLDYPKEKLRLIVVSDASDDATDAIASSYAHAGVELIRIEGRVGKTEARNRALQLVDSEVVIFSDATTEYKSDVVRKLVRNFADTEVGMATGQLIYVDPENTQMGIGQKLYWKYESLIKRAQTNMGTLTGSIGCMTAFRRSAYTALPAHVIEDFTEPLMFIQKNYRIVYEEEAICYEKTTQKTGSEWRMRIRVIRGGLTSLFFAREILNPITFPIPFIQLLSHKILRWFVPVFAIALFVLSVMGKQFEPQNQFIHILLSLQVTFYLLVLFSFVCEKCGIRLKFLGIPLYFFIINAASLVAIFKTMTEELEPHWEPERN